MVAIYMIHFIEGVLRENGNIVKCLDEYVDNFIVSDDLRKCLLMPEFEFYDIFSDVERKEFIFHVFKSLCLGGKLCQYEDSIKEYNESTKLVYKDLISVVKDESGLRVSSHVYKIVGADSAHSPLFPMEHVQNFCYVSIDAMRRHVNIWYHASNVYY